MTAVKCYDRFKNDVAPAVKNPAVVAAQHLSPGVSKSCEGLPMLLMIILGNRDLHRLQTS